MSRVQRLCRELPKLTILHPLDEFALFPKLPLELRYRIWGLTAMVPRNIYLRKRNYLSIGDDQPEAPAILAISQESRREGKRYYRLCKELKFVPDHLRYSRQIMVWINFNTDNFIWDEILCQYPRLPFGHTPRSPQLIHRHTSTLTAPL